LSLKYNIILIIINLEEHLSL